MRIRSEEDWREIIAAWERSGLTVSQFCKSNKVGNSGFYKWLKQIRCGDSHDKSIVVSSPKKTTLTQEFIPIDVSSLRTAESKTMLCIVTSYGARLEIPL